MWVASLNVSIQIYIVTHNYSTFLYECQIFAISLPILSCGVRVRFLQREEEGGRIGEKEAKKESGRETSHESGI